MTFLMMLCAAGIANLPVVALFVWLLSGRGSREAKRVRALNRATRAVYRLGDAQVDAILLAISDRQPYRAWLHKLRADRDRALAVTEDDLPNEEG